MARIAVIWEEKGEHFAEIQGRIKNSITITIQMLSTSMRATLLILCFGITPNVLTICCLPKCQLFSPSVQWRGLQSKIVDTALLLQRVVTLLQSWYKLCSSNNHQPALGQNNPSLSSFIASYLCPNHIFLT